MSKTVNIQIEKSRNLLVGLEKHLRESVDTQVTNEEIKETESLLEELARISAECDRLRAELSPKVKEMNNLLTKVKQVCTEQKKIIKGRYPQERWADYGVPDKR